MVRENKMYNLLGMNEERQQRLKQVLAEMWEQSRPETLERVLVKSTRDVAPTGRDDATGAGAVDLEAALVLLRGGTPR